MSTDDRLERGLQIQRELRGQDSREQGDEFTIDMVRMSVELTWADVWGREGLARRDRSLLTLGILAGLHRPDEFRNHVKIGIKNGLTVDELREICIHIRSYCGGPAGSECLRIAREELVAQGHQFAPRKLG